MCYVNTSLLNRFNDLLEQEVEKRDAFLVWSDLLYRMLMKDRQNNNSNNKKGYS